MRNASCLFASISALTTMQASVWGVDCNFNGREDTCDLSCAPSACQHLAGCGTSTDCNSNGVPDDCETFPPTEIRSVRVASSNEVVFVAAPQGDDRLWIVEKAGRIRLMKDGAVLPTPFLDLSTQVATDGERGLVGMAFHPNYRQNATFFLYYTDRSGRIVLAKYRAAQANPDSDTAGSAGVVLKSLSTTSSFHNGGCLQFGPDGYLYAGIGDGGNDANAQNRGTLFGKMIRLDVDNPPTYVPDDNPFVDAPPLDEIWSLGWRNPWRFSFDELNGAMYVADVGTDRREEIDFEPADSPGRNYGWRCMEGTECTGMTGCACNSSTLVMPIHDYTHDDGSCAVIGGYVYRGCAIPSLQGTYFYADLCGDYLKSLRYSPTTGATEHLDRTLELDPATIRTLYTFGRDGQGELYYAGASGVYKIVAGPPLDPVCGNGVRESGEECDDGNFADGDGCDSDCRVEQSGASGACCVGNSCTAQSLDACRAAGGDYQGDGTTCTDGCGAVPGPNCQDLRDFEPLKAQCGDDGRVDFLVVLNNTLHSGETVTVAVENQGVQRVFTPTIDRRLAGGSHCCLHGTVTVSLIQPAGCIAPVTINCP